MQKPAESVLRGKGRQCLDDRLLESLTCASPNASQDGFQFGKCPFNRRKIGRVRGQKQQLAAFVFDGLPHLWPLMSREIIQDHDLSRTQAGSQDLLHISLEGRRIRRSIQQECFSHPLHRQRSDQCQVGPIITRNVADRTLASRSVGIERRHVDLRTRFIHDDQILRGQVVRLLSPGRPNGFILFAGSQRFFLRVQPNAMRARLMEAVLTLIPVRSSHIWQCCSRVA